MWGSIAVGAIGLLSASNSANAASNASNAQIAATDRGIAEQRRQFDITQENNAPYLETGKAGNIRLRQLLGLDSGYGGADSGSLLRKFTAADMNADPVYQSGLDFGLKSGTDAINSRAIATGGYDSGATLKALTRFGNDYGSTKAGDSFNRYQTEQGNVYNRLAGVSGTGQTAVNTVSSAGQNAANNISGMLTDQGNAAAAGIVGGANAWGGALNSVSGAINNYQSNQILQKLLANKGY